MAKNSCRRCLFDRIPDMGDVEESGANSIIDAQVIQR